MREEFFVGTSLNLTLTQTLALTYLYLSSPHILEGTPGFLLELFHRGPCCLGRVVLATRASDQSRSPFTRKGYPKPLAHRKALLPGSGFISKT